MGGRALNNIREAARAALIDLWAQEGFRVPARENSLFRVLWETAEWPDETRKRLGIVSDHEAEWRARQGL
jgi:hypothetical protein